MPKDLLDLSFLDNGEGSEKQPAPQQEQDTQLLDVSFLDSPEQSVQEEDWGTVLNKTIGNLPDRFALGVNAIIQDIRDRFSDSVTNISEAQTLTDRLKRNPNDEEARAVVTNLGVNPDEIAASTSMFDAANQQLSEAIRLEKLNKDPEVIKLVEEAADLQETLKQNAPVTEQWSAKGIISNILGSLAEMAPGVIAAVATKKPSVGSAFIASNVYGQSLAEGKEMGLDAGQSRNRAYVMALAEFFPETMALGQLFKRGGTFAGDLARTGLSESAQEMVTQTINEAYDAGIVGEETTLGEAINNIAYSGVVGFGAGTTMGVATAPIRSEPVDKLDREVSRSVSDRAASPDVDALDEMVAQGDALDAQVEQRAQENQIPDYLKEVAQPDYETPAYLRQAAPERRTADITDELGVDIPKEISPTAEELIFEPQEVEPVEGETPVLESVGETIRDADIAMSELDAEIEAARALFPEEEVEPEPTVQERREAMEQKLYEQRVEGGIGEIQKRLSRPAAPSAEALIKKAPEEAGPTPGELEFRRQQNEEFLQERKTAKVPESLREHEHGNKIMTKGYRDALRGYRGLSQKVSRATKLDPSVDSISEAAAKAGGLSRSQASKEGFDEVAFKRNKAFPVKGGKTFDEMAETLNQYGYRNREGGPLTANDVVDLVSSEVNNQETHYSSQVDPDMITEDSAAVREWSRELGGNDKLNNAITKALRGEKLGPKQSRVIGEILDTVNAIRSEDIPDAIETLQAKREERRSKEVDAFNELVREVSPEYESDFDTYSEVMSELPEEADELDAAFVTIAEQAYDVNPDSVERVLDRLETGDMDTDQAVDEFNSIINQVQPVEDVEPETKVKEEAPEPTVEDKKPEPVEEVIEDEPIEEEVEAERPEDPEPVEEAEVEAEAATETEGDQPTDVKPTDDTLSERKVSLEKDEKADAARAISSMTQDEIISEIDELIDKDERIFKESGLDSRFRENLQNLSGSERDRLRKLRLSIRTDSATAARQRNLERVRERNEKAKSRAIKTEELGELEKEELREFSSRVKSNAKSFMGNWGGKPLKDLAVDYVNTWLDTGKPLSKSQKKDLLIKHDLPEEAMAMIDSLDQSNGFGSELLKEPIGRRYSRDVSGSDPELVLMSMGKDTADFDAYAEDEGFYREDYDTEQDYRDAVSESLNDTFEDQVYEMADIDNENDVKIVIDHLNLMESLGVKVNNEIEERRWRKAFDESAPEKEEFDEVDDLSDLGESERRQLSFIAQELPYLESQVKNSDPFTRKKLQEDIDFYKSAREMLLSGMTIEEVKSALNVKPMASIDRGVKKGVSSVEVQKEVDDFFNEYAGVAPVTVSVVESASDSPVEVKKGRKVRAVFNPGDLSLVIVSGNLNSSEETRNILRHELIVHYGLRSLMGKERYNMHMDRLLRSKDKRLMSVMDEVRDTYDGYIDLDSKEGQRILAEEALAKISEGDLTVGPIRRFVNAILRALKKIKFIPDTATYTDAVNLINSNAEGLRKRVVGKGDVVTDPIEATYDENPYLASLYNESTINDAPVSDDIKDSIKSVHFTGDNRSFVQRVKDALTVDMRAARQGIIDQFESIKTYEIEKFGTLMSAEESAYKMSAMSTDTNAIVETALKYGVPKYDNGAVSMRDGVKPLQDVIGQVTDLDPDLLPVWTHWLAAKRVKDQRLIEQGKEQLFTQEMVDEIFGYVNENPEMKRVFEQAQKDYAKFNKATLDFAEDAGLINRESREMWENDSYVPFYRITEEAQRSGPFGKRGIEGQSAGIKALRGGTDKLNILESMVQNPMHLIGASYKNLAMQKVVELTEGVAMDKVPLKWQPVSVSNTEIARALRDIGIDFDRLTSEQREQYSTLFRMNAPQGENIVSVMKDGKREYYEVNDPLLLNSVTALGPQPVNEILRFMGIPKRLLTNMVTSTPPFMVRNFIRDTVANYVQADKSTGTTTKDSITDAALLKPFRRGMSGMAASIKEDKDRWTIMGAGGMSGEYFGSSTEDVTKDIVKPTKSGVARAVSSLFNGYRHVVRGSEEATRIAVYRQVKENGGSDFEAAYQAKNVLNFSRHGQYKVVQFLIQTVPFFNARLQGLERLYQGAKASPASFAMRGALLAAATFALMAMNDDREEYWALPEWERDTYWHAWVDDVHIRIPKPFEVGAVFATVPERMYEAATRDEKVFLSRMGNMFIETFAMNPIPQVFSPIVEQVSNRSFFMDRPIVSMSLENLSPELQFTNRTSQIAKYIAQLMPDFMPEWTRSPVRVEHLVNSYFGTVGGYVLMSGDYMAKKMTDAPIMPAKRVTEYPLISDFIRTGERSSKYVGRFYDMAEQANKINSSIKDLIRQERMDEAREQRAEYGSILQIRRKLNRSRKRMSDLNTKIKRIYINKNLSAEEKRRKIELFTRKKNDIAKDISEQYWKLF